MNPTQLLRILVWLAIFVAGVSVGVAAHRYLILPAMAPNLANGAVFLSIVTGIASGLLTILLGSVFKGWVLPQYRALIYDNVEISGQWLMSSPMMSQTGMLQLDQRASKLSGVLTLIAEADAAYDQTRNFNVTGEITNSFVMLSVKHSDRTRLGLGSILLQLQGDGRHMSGFYLFYAITLSRLTYADVRFSRPGAVSPAQRELILRTVVPELPIVPSAPKKKGESLQQTLPAKPTEAKDE